MLCLKLYDIKVKGQRREKLNVLGQKSSESWYCGWAECWGKQGLILITHCIFLLEQLSNSNLFYLFIKLNCLILFFLLETVSSSGAFVHLHIHRVLWFYSTLHIFSTLKHFVMEIFEDTKSRECCSGNPQVPITSQWFP